MEGKTTADRSAFRTWMGDDAVARSYVLEGANVDLTDAIENSKAVNDLYNGHKFPLLVNITEINSITKEARSYFAVNDRETHITAFAIVGKSEVGKVIANFFFKLNRVAVPARMFTNEEKALIWLEKYKPNRPENHVETT